MDRFDDELEALIEKVIGCAIEVHRLIRPGFNESVYANALEREFIRRNVRYQREHSFRVEFKGDVVGEGRIDFWVGNRLVVEIKAAKGIDAVHVAQVVGYLAHKNEPVGLILNFNVALMKQGIRRVVRSREI